MDKMIFTCSWLNFPRLLALLPCFLMAWTWRVAKKLCVLCAAWWWSPGLRNAIIIPLSSLEAARDVGKASVTAAAYAGCPLSTITPQLRGGMLTAVARNVSQKLYPNSAIKDPIPGQRCDGSKRGLYCAEYDWLRNGRRVQCKSAQMVWVESSKHWRVQFKNIKLSLFDELVLVFYGPSGLHFFTHDGRSGLPTGAAKRVCAGAYLGYYAPRGLEWREAEGALLNKLQQLGQCIAHLKTSDDLVIEVLQQRAQSVSSKLQGEAFAQHPFNSFTPAARSFLFQRVVQEVVDLLRHPSSESSASGVSKSQKDWHRDGLQIKCKSARLAWSGNGWKCNFHALSSGTFDMFYLALDTPSALHIFQYDSASGKPIGLFGPAKATNVSVAVEVMTEKLLSLGSQHVASVVWT